MAISSIGNLTFINQNSQVSATHQAGIQHRADVANVANMQDFQNKLSDIQEVRKLEENEAINPDRDSQKQRQESEAKEQQEREGRAESEEELVPPSIHLLDIKA